MTKLLRDDTQGRIFSLLVVSCAKLTVAGTSNCSTEERFVPSVWVHENDSVV